jgi:hypothetical protein
MQHINYDENLDFNISMIIYNRTVAMVLEEIDLILTDLDNFKNLIFNGHPTTVNRFLSFDDVYDGKFYDQLMLLGRTRIHLFLRFSERIVLELKDCNSAYEYFDGRDCRPCTNCKIGYGTTKPCNVISDTVKYSFFLIFLKLFLQKLFFYDFIHPSKLLKTFFF